MAAKRIIYTYITYFVFLLGFPPTGLFFAKVFLINHLIQFQFYSLASFVILFSIIGFYYFLKVIKLMIYNKTNICFHLRQMPTANLLFAITSLFLSIFLPFMFYF